MIGRHCSNVTLFSKGFRLAVPFRCLLKPWFKRNPVLEGIQTQITDIIWNATSRSNVTLFSKGFRRTEQRGQQGVLRFKRNPVLEGI